jgi:tetratricopeptide (TPR) repeat protein
MFRAFMWAAAVLLTLDLVMMPAAADDRKTCNEGTGDASIAACGRLIAQNPRDATAYNNRGAAYYRKSQNDSAISDLNEALRLNPKYVEAYNNRGAAYFGKGDYDRAIADFSEAIRFDPRHTQAYNNRGAAYNLKHDYDHAIADFDEAIRLDPKKPDAYSNRGVAYAYKGDYDRAIADEDRALRLRPDNAHSYGVRGYAHARKGDLDNAMADVNKALSLNARYAAGYAYRAAVYELRGDLDRAMADAERAIQIDPKSSLAYSIRAKVWFDRKDYARAIAAADEALKLNPFLTDARKDRERAQAALLTLSTPTKPADNAPPSSHAATAERRVALVIGNSGYTSSLVTPLPNPRHDADLVAEALGQAGFETTEITDLDRAGMVKALQAFRAKADASDWALVYFAGHGIEVNRINYLLPIDAKLADSRDVKHETVSYEDFAEAIGGAKALRIIVLDACRNNPFKAHMHQTAALRSGLDRGLAAPPEAEPGTLIVYSAKEGEAAVDGDGVNSPFALAFTTRLKMPGREVRRVFDDVSDDVIEATGKRQQPFMYGRLPGKRDFFFVAGR